MWNWEEINKVIVEANMEQEWDKADGETWEDIFAIACVELDIDPFDDRFEL